MLYKVSLQQEQMVGRKIKSVTQVLGKVVFEFFQKKKKPMKRNKERDRDREREDRLRQRQTETHREINSTV